MTLPSNIDALIAQINYELDNLKHELSQSIELISSKIDLFPENMILIQFFASLNNYALFTENTRRKIQETKRYFSDRELSDEELQEAGEDLLEQLGRTIEAKIIVNNIKSRLSDYP